MCSPAIKRPRLKVIICEVRLGVHPQKAPLQVLLTVKVSISLTHRTEVVLFLMASSRKDEEQEMLASLNTSKCAFCLTDVLLVGLHDVSRIVTSSLGCGGRGSVPEREARGTKTR
jgi:hypothetical protein